MYALLAAYSVCPAVAALAHAGQQAPGQLGGGGQQHLQEVRVGPPVVRHEAAGHAVAGVVDQPVHGEAAPLQFLAQDAGSGGGGKIDGKHGHFAAMPLAQFGRQGLQPVGTARGQHQVVPARGERAGEGRTDAGGGAGDEAERMAWRHGCSRRDEKPHHRMRAGGARAVKHPDGGRTGKSGIPCKRPSLPIAGMLVTLRALDALE
jgi:hypothetical protein